MYLLIFKDGKAKYSNHEHGHPAWDDLVKNESLRVFKLQASTDYARVEERGNGHWLWIEQVDDITGV